MFYNIERHFKTVGDDDLFIIWGFGHNRTKSFGVVGAAVCGRCNNNVQRGLLKVTTWFTLFFIPVIPYRTMYLLICPICGQPEELTKESFLEMAGQADGMPIGHADSRPVDKYAGKTETQIAYLKQMEELRQAKE